MRPITVQTVISAPREQVFELLGDLSRRVAWCDHYMKDYRLARAKPVGLGAAARFQARGDWAEISIAEYDPPRRIVEEGRMGRIGRSRLCAVWELAPQGRGATRVVLTVWTEPATFADRLKESFGARRWLRSQLRTALGRLRTVFEEPSTAPLARVTIAGYEPMKKARFGA